MRCLLPFCVGHLKAPGPIYKVKARFSGSGPFGCPKQFLQDPPLTEGARTRRCRIACGRVLKMCFFGMSDAAGRRWTSGRNRRAQHDNSHPHGSMPLLRPSVGSAQASCATLAAPTLLQWPGGRPGPDLGGHTRPVRWRASGHTKIATIFSNAATRWRMTALRVFGARLAWRGSKPNERPVHFDRRCLPSWLACVRSAPTC